MITKEEYEKIQSIVFGRTIKRTGGRKYFRFKGPLYCAECGASITAENKRKKQKNGNIHDYVYYHCTKRKDVNCSQGGIEEKKLEEQIKKNIEKINIPSEFHLWAIKWLRKSIKEDSFEEEKLTKKYERDYIQCEKEIDGLIGMRARNEIDKESYVKRMNFLKEEKIRLYDLINNNDNELEERIKKAEKMFTFAKDALEVFESNDPEKQKQILLGLGSNLTLKNKELFVLEEETLFSMERVASEVQVIHKNVRTSKNGLNNDKLEELYENSSNLLRG